MTQIIPEFTSAIRRFGLNQPDSVVADGRIHRFKSGPERELNGFYRLSVVDAHGGGQIGFGTIGCWKRGLNEKWCSRQKGEIGDADRAAIKKARAEQKKSEAAESAASIERARDLWSKSGPASPNHPYLLAKGIAPLGIRQMKDALVVPIYRDGGLVSLQFISADGTKRFLKGGSVEGGYASVSGKGAGREKIVIAEGYATAAVCTWRRVAVRGLLYVLQHTSCGKSHSSEISRLSDNNGG